MDFPLYSDVVLLHDFPEEGLCVGDIGAVAEVHNIGELETGYSVEFFDMNGNTVGLVTLPISYFRSPSSADMPSVRSADSDA